MTLFLIMKESAGHLSKTYRDTTVRVHQPITQLAEQLFPPVSVDNQLNITVLCNIDNHTDMLNIIGCILRFKLLSYN